MKKRICLGLCLVMAVVSILAGCGGSDGSPGAASAEDHSEKSSGVEEVLAAGMQEDEAEAPASEEAAPEEPVSEDSAPEEPAAAEPASGDSAPAAEEPAAQEPAAEEATADLATDVDVDLTVLSATMVYSEVYNMMTHPDDYIGKSIRMRGDYAYMHDDATGNDYFACIIRDATACCAQGIEFVLTEEYVFPDDYPQEGDEITVTGVFDVYTEGTSKYCTLRGAELE